MQEQLKMAEDKMKKCVDHLLKEYAAVRAGRANPAILDKVVVDYFGTPTPINQMAAVSVTEARVLQIQPWDASTVKSINKALLASDIGITPIDDGKVIRLVFPQLTEERRKEITKSIKKLGDEAKVNVRNVRRDAMEKLKAMKKNGELTEDDMKNGEKKMQTITDKYCAEADKHMAAKEQEVMSL